MLAVMAFPILVSCMVDEALIYLNKDKMKRSTAYTPTKYYGV
jgi:hypothetical protein